jgi:hypothetical protein
MHPDAGSMVAEAGNRVVIMVMAQVEPEPVIPWGNKNSYRCIGSLYTISLKGCDTFTWHLLIDFTFHLQREHCSIKANALADPAKD